MKPYEKLKQIRIQKGKTTYELSADTGISQSTISKMENNKRKIDTESMQKIAIALNVPTSIFFDEEDIPQLNSDLTNEIIEKYNLLTDDYKEYVLKQITELLELQEKNKNS